MAFFKISAMKSPMQVFPNDSYDSRSHHISVMVNGSSVLSSTDEEAMAKNGKNESNRHNIINNNKGRAPSKTSEDLVVETNAGNSVGNSASIGNSGVASSRIYLRGESPAGSPVRSSVAAAGTTSIRVSEVINRENQDRAETTESGRVVSISSPDSCRVSSQIHPPRAVAPSISAVAATASASSSFNPGSHPVRGFSLRPEETEEEQGGDGASLALQPQQVQQRGPNRFPLVHQSRFDEETDGARVEGSSSSPLPPPPYPSSSSTSSIRIVKLVSVSASPTVTMVPGALNHDQQNNSDETENNNSFKTGGGADLIEKGGSDSLENLHSSESAISGPQIKLSSYVSLGNDHSDESEGWLKNQNHEVVSLVPNEDCNRDRPVTTAINNNNINNNNNNTGVSDSNEDLTVVCEESDVLAEGIKLRVSFGNREPDEMVSRSPDDGYHDDDTLSEEESTGLHHPVVINETVPSTNDGIHMAIPVRLSDSTTTTNYDREMRFIKVNHVRHDSDVFDDDANSSLGSETGTILSRRGTIRGMRNQVRSSIAAFLENMASKRQYSKEETGRVVLYTTSMGVVRRTHDLCRRARNIMYTLMARFEERDVFMNRLFQQEVCERLHLDQVIVPQLFVDGVHIGNADVIERLNETGELRKLLEPYKKQSVGSVCQLCGDFRFLPCTTCGGSKKSLQHRHQFSEEIVALRCMVCDENGLIRCSICLNDDQS